MARESFLLADSLRYLGGYFVRGYQPIVAIAHSTWLDCLGHYFNLVSVPYRAWHGGYEQ
jgi:hypothetical protein